MTETNVSLYKESLMNVESFLKTLNFPTSQIICDGMVTVVNMISDYHEEGKSLNPDILLIHNDSFFKILPYQYHIALQTEEIHDKSFSMAVKMCAPLAENGWIMYLLLIDENHFQYGIVNVSLTQMSVSLFNQVIETPQELAICAYIRKIGNKVVELNSISNHCVISLSLNNYDVKMEDEIQKLTDIILEDVEPSYPIRNETATYIKDMFIDALNHGHGNLIAVSDNIELLQKDGHLKGGIYLPDEIDFTSLLVDNHKQRTDQTATTLNAFTQLTISMLNFDGITLFNTKGCVVGYHFIVDNKLEAEKSIVGGSRTRAFEALTQTNGISACLMKSQDGNIKYFKK